MKTLLASTAAAAAVFSAAALAQESDTRQLGAHVHGEARLSVALDPDAGLALAELTGAAWNFYGFERAPQTDAERETVAAVRAALAQEDVIAWPDRAGCSLGDVTLDTGMTGAGRDRDHGEADDPDHGHHDHDPGDHGHEHEDDHGHDHGEEHHHDHGADAGHSDVAASWTFQCDRIAAADRFDAAGLFAALPRLERIDAEAFDGTRAAVRTLTGEDAVIRLN